MKKDGGKRGATSQWNQTIDGVELKDSFQNCHNDENFVYNVRDHIHL